MNVWQTRISEIFCSPMVKENVIDWYSCQERSSAGCAKEAVRGVRVGGEREKVRSILNVLVPCDSGFDLLINLFFIEKIL